MSSYASLALSVVVVATGGHETVARTLQHLQAQTVRDRLEVIIVAHTGMLSLDTAARSGFCGFQVVEVREISPVSQAMATGIRQAHAPAVALIEDHTYPAPAWAEVLIAAHQGPWSVVGSAIANANPQSMLSWANCLISYGPWVDPSTSHEVGELPGHNISYKRAVLLEYDAALEEMLKRESGFHPQLRSKGHRFYLPLAKLYHLNPSLLVSVAALRFAAGRLYGARRAWEGHWSPWRRLLYIAGSPLIPLLRLWRFKHEMEGTDAHAALWPRILPAATVGFVADGLGQAIGYALGPGNTLNRLDEFELQRLSQVTQRDRRVAMG
jgi:hypothetical protein